MSLTVIREQRGEDLFFKFTGPIDENAVMPQLPEPLPPKVIVHLRGVTLINSLGCRHWINWSKEFSTTGHLELVECPPAVVNQANILVGFLPSHSSVGSFFVPYFCELCAYEHLVLLKEGVNYSTGKLPDITPELPCPKCGEPMRLDVLQDRYLRFLTKG